MSGFNSVSLIKSLLNMARTEIGPNKSDDMSEMNVRMWTLCPLFCGSLKIMLKQLVQDILGPITS